MFPHPPPGFRTELKRACSPPHLPHAALPALRAAVADGDAKGQYTGSSAVPIGRWLDCWVEADLSRLHGFPV